MEKIGAVRGIIPSTKGGFMLKFLKWLFGKRERAVGCWYIEDIAPGIRFREAHEKMPGLHTCRNLPFIGGE